MHRNFCVCCVKLFYKSVILSLLCGFPGKKENVLITIILNWYIISFLDQVDCFDLLICYLSSILKKGDSLRTWLKKTPIALGKANDERWAELDDVVSRKMKKCNSLKEPLDFLQHLIYYEAANIFLPF